MGHGIAVTVKSKRGEGLGAIGRAEGIAVWAVALLARS
jgi:2C-methyl-D-erythritol 2,4-cyclodiphosphate synthase